MPVYEYDILERVPGRSRSGRTRRRLRRVDPGVRRGHSYRIRADRDRPGSARRALGELGRRSRWADFQEIRRRPLARRPGRTMASDVRGRRPVDLTMSDPTVAASREDRYLFSTAQRGLRDVAIQASRAVRTTFEAWAPPGMYVTGVRFTGSAYVESPDFYAAFRVRDRGLDGRARPATPPAMRPAARSRSASPCTTRQAIRQRPRSSCARSTRSCSRWARRRPPTPERALRGRPDWVSRPPIDHIALRAATTTTAAATRPAVADATTSGTRCSSGAWRREPTVGPPSRFNLSDDLTSWRVSASALGANLQAGEGTVQIPVGLPFFADATIAPEYLVSDRPEIGLRAFGTALTAGTPRDVRRRLGQPRAAPERHRGGRLRDRECRASQAHARAP